MSSKKDEINRSKDLFVRIEINGIPANFEEATEADLREHGWIPEDECPKSCVSKEKLKELIEKKRKTLVQGKAFRELDDFRKERMAGWNEGIIEFILELEDMINGSS